MPLYNPYTPLARSRRDMGTPRRALSCNASYTHLFITPTQVLLGVVEVYCEPRSAATPPDLIYTSTVPSSY
jgi:hypothetical protein